MQKFKWKFFPFQIETPNFFNCEYGYFYFHKHLLELDESELKTSRQDGAHSIWNLTRFYCHGAAVRSTYVEQKFVFTYRICANKPNLSPKSSAWAYTIHGGKIGKYMYIRKKKPTNDPNVVRGNCWINAMAWGNSVGNLTLAYGFFFTPVFFRKLKLY